MGVDWVFPGDIAVDLDLDIPCIQGDGGCDDDMEVGIACVDLRLDKFSCMSYDAIKLLRSVSFCECFENSAKCAIELHYRKLIHQTGCSKSFAKFFKHPQKEWFRLFDRIVSFSNMFLKLN